MSLVESVISYSFNAMSTINVNKNTPMNMPNISLKLIFFPLVFPWFAPPHHFNPLRRTHLIYKLSFVWNLWYALFSKQYHQIIVSKNIQKTYVLHWNLPCCLLYQTLCTEASLSPRKFLHQCMLLIQNYTCRIQVRSSSGSRLYWYFLQFYYELLQTNNVLVKIFIFILQPITI